MGLHGIGWDWMIGWVEVVQFYSANKPYTDRYSILNLKVDWVGWIYIWLDGWMDLRVV